MYLAAFMVAGFVLAACYAVALLRGNTSQYVRRRADDPAHRGRGGRPGAGARRRLGRPHGRRRAAGQAGRAGRARPDHHAARRCTSAAGTSTARSRFGLPIPRLLSLLAAHDPNATIRGLSSFPAADLPPVNVVRVAFQTMVGLGMALALLAVCYLWVRFRRGRPPSSRWFYRAVVLAGPAAVVALVAGWVTTEVGRQPWVVYGVMRTEDAVTGASGIPVGYGVLVVVYAGVRGRGLVDPAPARRPAVPGAAGRRGGRGRGAVTLLQLLPLLFVLAGLTLYTVLAGADLGTGLWHLTAGRDHHLRSRIYSSIGPVWEANHVWLIFVLTVTVDGVPAGVRGGLHHAGGAAVPGRGRDHPARHRVRAARGVARAGRPPGDRHGLRAVLDPHAVRARARRRRDRVRAGAGGRRRQRGDQLAQPDLGADRRARGRARGVPGGGPAGGRLGPGRRRRRRRRRSGGGRWSAACWPGPSRWAGWRCCGPTRGACTTGSPTGRGSAAWSCPVLFGVGTLGLVRARRLDPGPVRGGRGRRGADRRLGAGAAAGPAAGADRGSRRPRRPRRWSPS